MRENTNTQLFQLLEDKSDLFKLPIKLRIFDTKNRGKKKVRQHRKHITCFQKHCWIYTIAKLGIGFIWNLEINIF